VRDHEAILADFAAQLACRGLSEHQVAELLDHLHCSIEQRVDAGSAPAVATREAIAAVGDVVGITREYKKGELMHPLQKFLGITFALCAILVGLNLQGAHMVVFFSELAIVPLLMITGVTVGGLVASFGMRRTTQLLSAAALGRTVAVTDAPLLQQVCQRGQRLVWTACLLMLTFSTMHIMSILDHPAMIGPGIAWALIAVVYSALIADLGFGSAERWIMQQAV
jgi:uncharacterized membrane protein (UPF0136 family)